MSPELLASFVGLASYAAVSLLLTVAVCGAWAAGLRHVELSGHALLGLRLLPSIGGAFVAISVCLPAFLRFEPPDRIEEAGPLLVGLSVMALTLAGHGLIRGLRAAAATRALFPQSATLVQRRSPNGLPVEVVDTPVPIVAVVGAWRPRLIIGRHVAAHCTSEEFARIIAHEEAHTGSKDNLKQFLMRASPDPLAWLSTGRALEDRWRLASEHAADERATNGSAEDRLLLASALVKVARLALTATRQPSMASMLIGVEGIEARVRRLLEPPSATTRARLSWLLPTLLVAAAVMAVRAHQTIHAGIELVVALGR